MLVIHCIRATSLQTAFAMFPVLQPAFMLAALELADSDILRHSCDRQPEPIKQLPEHGIPPGDKPPGLPAAAAFFCLLLVLFELWGEL
jgi:hypothetical protein